MQAQGADVFNTQYIDDLTAAIHAVRSCAELQALTNEAMASLAAAASAMTAQLANLFPLQALLSIPTSLPELLTWVENYINDYLTPQLAPYAKYVAKAAAFAEAILALNAAINAKGGLFADCTITIPPVSVTLPT